MQFIQNLKVIGQKCSRHGGTMYHHIKNLMYTVKVGTPSMGFGNMLLEQFGGANGELAAAMQYTIQGWNCVDDLARRDLLLDIGTEELSHLEVVGALIRMHLKPLKENREAADADPLLRIAGGGGIALVSSTGNAWTGDYLKITGEFDVNRLGNIVAESCAKIVYERLINYTDDPGTIDTLQFLMPHEITRLNAFSAALESLEKSPFSIGRPAVTLGIVDEYFNDSTGEGTEGDAGMHGPLQGSFGLHPVESQMAGGKGSLLAPSMTLLVGKAAASRMPERRRPPHPASRQLTQSLSRTRMQVKPARRQLWPTKRFTTAHINVSKKLYLKRQVRIGRPMYARLAQVSVRRKSLPS
jgi:Mn-containing catalase